MDTLSTSFTISVSGSPIAPAPSSSEERIPAETGSEPAVFTLKDGKLESGDYFLGRAAKEDRSFLPKPIFWFKKDASEKQIKPVTAEKDGDQYILKFQNASLMAEEGKVLANLTGETHEAVQVSMK